MTLEELLRQGKSFGQGASNAAASTVTGPVDMLAWLLRKGGVPVGDTPIGGEAWMRQKGLMATPENKLAGLLGEGAGLAAPIVAAAKAPEIAGGLLQMGRNLATPQTMNKQTGAIVYHGSPHKFDKFDSSKIGTGEGAQAYGHGLYLAENPAIAKSYQSGITGDEFLTDKGGAINKRTLESMGFTNSEIDIGLRALKRSDGDVKAASEIVGSAHNKPLSDFFLSFKNGLTKNDNPGQLYKVDLPDEHIAKMLDWDKPLSQQPEIRKMVPKELEDILSTSKDIPWTVGKTADEFTGQDLYRAFSSLQGTNQLGTNVLKDAGIPGIRYLDGGSRSAGAGSSNFVIFPQNEGLLQILERNGKPIK